MNAPVDSPAPVYSCMGDEHNFSSNSWCLTGFHLLNLDKIQLPGLLSRRNDRILKKKDYYNLQCITWDAFDYE